MMHYRATVTPDDSDDTQTIGLAAADEELAHNILDIRFGEDAYTVEELEEVPPEQFAAEPAEVQQQAPENNEEE